MCCVLQIEPYLAAKRVRYTASGNLADPMFDIYNYNDRDGTFKFVKVSKTTKRKTFSPLSVPNRLFCLVVHPRTKKNDSDVCHS